MLAIQKKQQGVGTIGFMILLAVFLSVIYVAWKLAPIYMENYALKKTLASVESKNLVVSTASTSKNTATVRNYLAKQFRVNNIKDVPLDNIRVRKVQGKYEIDVNYEVRTHIFANIDALVGFNERAELN